MDAPLFELERLAEIEFPNLRTARAESERRLEERREALKDIGLDADSSVIFAGSIARSEAVTGSDDDFILLVDDPERADQMTMVLDALGQVKGFKKPSDSGLFAEPVMREDLIHKIGLSADDNFNTTRRMLFLLESTWVAGREFYEDSFDLMLDRYIDESVKDHRPPRFILNDLIRYWRTMCVDFAGKEHNGPAKWGIRNAKLRTSRKLLFAGGLLPVLSCAQMPKDEMKPFLRQRFALPPTDRLAQTFMEREDAIDAGARTLKAYDDFIGILDDEEHRAELERMDRAAASGSELFQQVKGLGKTVEQGLLMLLFEPGDSNTLSQEYLIF